MMSIHPDYQAAKAKARKAIQFVAERQGAGKSLIRKTVEITGPPIPP